MWLMSSSICGINMRPNWPENKKKIQEKLCPVTYGPPGIYAFKIFLSRDLLAIVNDNNTKPRSYLLICEHEQ